MTNNIAPLILAVDDDRDFLEIIQAKLESQGYRVITATDGNDAVAKAKSAKPAIILMDVEMPHKDGVATTLTLHADPLTSHIPIIFLTSLGDSSMIDLNQK